MAAQLIIKRLESIASPENREGMARYGINTERAYGISVYKLREMAKEMGKDHELALKLWETGIHEAQMLAIFTDDPEQVTQKQMEDWAKDFDSWDTCDQACTDLFDRTPFAYEKALEWSLRPEEFVKRGGFALMAGLAVHDKKAPDGKLAEFFPVIERESKDPRNYVRKAVNWALRNIGKRNLALNTQAIESAERIKAIDDKTARWIASDALRELRSEKVRKRLGR